MKNIKLLYKIVKNFQNELNTTEKERWIRSRPFLIKFNELRKLVIVEFPDAEKYTTEQKVHEGMEAPLSSIERFSAVKLETNTLVDFMESKLDKSEEIVSDVLGIITKKLRASIRKEPQNEKEVQEKVDTILNVSNFQYSREQVSIPFSSKHYIPDFTFETENTALEIKMCNRKGKERTLIDEINSDIVAYKTRYKKLIFIVYDNGLIRDVPKFKQDIKNQENVYIEVIKH